MAMTNQLHLVEENTPSSLMWLSSWLQDNTLPWFPPVFVATPSQSLWLRSLIFRHCRDPGLRNCSFFLSVFIPSVISPSLLALKTISASDSQIYNTSPKLSSKLQTHIQLPTGLSPWYLALHINQALQRNGTNRMDECSNGMDGWCFSIIRITDTGKSQGL